MKDRPVLTLVRHAHAEWPNYRGRDFDRPLTKQGVEQAVITARALRAARVRPDLLLSSPARRTHETAMIVARELELSTDALILDVRMYNASVGKLESLAREAATRHAHVMMVAHNPGISELALRLTGDPERSTLKPSAWVSGNL